MTISDRDRAFMRRLGELKSSAHAEAAAAHASLPIAERLRRSWRLFDAHRRSASKGRAEDDPAAFYARARALGLYRP